LALLFCVSLASPVYAAESPVKVLVDGRELKADVPPQIIDGRVMLPARAVFEEMGAVVAWSEGSGLIQAVRGDMTVKIRVGEPVMYVNGRQVDLPGGVVPQIIDGRTLFPVRAAADSLDLAVEWDEASRTVTLTSPAAETPEDDKKTDADDKKAITDGAPAKGGDSPVKEDDRTLTMQNGETVTLGGLPSSGYTREEVGMGGFTWRVYNADYTNFHMVAVEKGLVCGVYSNSRGFSFGGVSYGDKPKDASIDGYNVKFYTDSGADGAAVAVLVLPKDLENRGEMETDEAFLAAQSLENFDMVNAFRAGNGSSPLEWDEAAEEAARLHSADMADNNYFDHVSPDGRRAINRYLEAAGESVPYTIWGENIVAGYEYGADAFDAWLNSPKHRENMINPEFRYMGVGSAYNAESTYYYYATQVFVTY
jgi:uncharacterized protein YkwD